MMLGLPSSVRIYLAKEPTDMRKGFNGLAASVEASGGELYSGHLFVFLSKRLNRAKILFWDRGGFVLWCKRLERGCFRRPKTTPLDHEVTLDPVQLTLLLDGIDVEKVHRGRFWSPPTQKTASGGSTTTVAM